MAKTLIGNIKGPQGEQGPQGPQGIQGIQGPQGEQGPPGLEIYGAEGQFVGFSANGNTVALDVPFNAGVVDVDRALVSGSDGKLVASNVSTQELECLSGVTSPLQKQIGDVNTALNAKANSSDVNQALNSKVTAVTGKALSTNDFTDAYKQKLDGIEAGANNYSLGDGVVATAKIANSAVTAVKIANNAVSTTYTATIGTGWSGSAAPYSIAVTVSGILADDTPIIDLVPSSTFATAEQQMEAWGYVYRAVTAANKVTFYATEKPTVSIPIQIKAVRK